MMIITFLFLTLSTIFELLTAIIKNYKIKVFFLLITMFCLSFANSLLIVKYLSFLTIVIVFFSSYIILNLIRIFKNSQNKIYRNKSYIITSLYFYLYQLIALFTFYIFSYVLPNLRINQVILYNFSAFLLLLIMLYTLFKFSHILKSTLLPEINQWSAKSDLPTLSVLIPARNETSKLAECLNSLVNASYPKLEILVLDDCSQKKKTPEIIRSFAHQGVRFIEGKAPSIEWLAKNYAYHQLAKQADGQFLLFCGVDIRFSIDSLVNMIETAIKNESNMISIIPTNVPRANSLSMNKQIMKNLYVQPIRYAWELIGPKIYNNKPPVLSSCWLIRSSVLEESGGFQAVKRSIIPERYFALFCHKHGSYNFLRSNLWLGITSHKSSEEQFATAIRTKYPLFHKRLEIVALSSFIEIIVPIYLFWLLIISLSYNYYLLLFLSLFALLIFSGIYYKVINICYNQPINFINYVIVCVLLYDIYLLNYSMWLYEFKTVLWKGRNICLPIMQVYSDFPKN